MRCIRNSRGFTLIETMIATMVLTFGLTGVAAMQISALNGSFTADSRSTGSSVALAWTEWLTGLMRNANQETMMYFGDIDTLHPENFVLLTQLDPNAADDLSAYDAATMDVYDYKSSGAQNPKPFVQLVMPSSKEAMVDMFNGDAPFKTSDGRSVTLRFRKLGPGPQLDPLDPTAPPKVPYIPFDVSDLPPPAPAGSRMIWRIAANVPVADTATVEISIVYANAFTRNRGATLRFVVGANMWGG